MARRDLNLVKLSYAEATLLFARLEREPTIRRSDEGGIAAELAFAEIRLRAAPDSERRKAEKDAAVAKIASLAILAFDDHVESFCSRITSLRARRPTVEMLAALELIQDRVDDIKRTAATLKQKWDGAPLLSALSQEPAVECRAVHALLCTCERAANSVRGWLGSRRDWLVALIVSVVVGLALIPVTLMISDRWDSAAQNRPRDPIQSTQQEVGASNKGNTLPKSSP